MTTTPRPLGWLTYLDATPERQQQDQLYRARKLGAEATARARSGQHITAKTLAIQAVRAARMSGSLL